MKILIKNGRVIDPANNIDDIRDILIEDTKISQVAKGIKNGCQQIIDAKDKIIIPGLVDMHVHLREPGREDKETIATGTRAALKGGVTTVLAMPNTNPSIDSVESGRLLKKIIDKSALANVLICGTITKGRKGQELSDIAGLKKEGAVAISDDGASVDNIELMSEALKKAKEAGMLVICHCEDKVLANQGVVNLGIMSTRLGLRGISRESEHKRVERDIQLAQKIDTPIHIAHISCRESVEIISQAKKNGVKISAETAPHYFSLSEEALIGYDTNMKMNPPLRTKDDLEVIKQGLKDGTIDVIASDHAPHTESEKEIEFERAEFGVIGLETILAISIRELVENGLLNWSDLVRKISLQPARILGIDKGSLGVGKEADLAVFSPDSEWCVEKAGLVSKSKNSAFLGRKLKARVEYTICSGKIAYGIKNIK
ncbi:dihydroorotase [bacterium]|nr:MAG: dihydroorotase [bacterium]